MPHYYIYNLQSHLLRSYFVNLINPEKFITPLVKHHQMSYCFLLAVGCGHRKLAISISASAQLVLSQQKYSGTLYSAEVEAPGPSGPFLGRTHFVLSPGTSLMPAGAGLAAVLQLPGGFVVLLSNRKPKRLPLISKREDCILIAAREHVLVRKFDNISKI